jgi:pre-rRNA-processing protein TSR3
MVRHKKDNFARGGKKFSNPRPRPVPRDEDDSGSSRPPFKAACWDLGHCDPKRCSGKRLMQFGMMRELAIGQKFQGVVVSYVAPRKIFWKRVANISDPRPNAKKVVSPADKDLLEQFGAAVVECSWVRVKEVPWSRIGGKCERLCTSNIAGHISIIY